jgi:hypothetical protein
VNFPQDYPLLGCETKRTNLDRMGVVGKYQHNLVVKRHVISDDLRDENSLQNENNKNVWKFQFVRQRLEIAVIAQPANDSIKLFYEPSDNQSDDNS